MDIYQYLPPDAEDYINCVRKLAALLCKVMDESEKTEFVSEDDKFKALQRLADDVETVACLRGDRVYFMLTAPAT